jgi:hypothetical protein
MANNEFRSTGRTVRRAAQFLQQALAKQGDWVTVQDHNDLEDSHRSLAQQVSGLLEMLNVNHDVDKSRVRVKLLRKKGD